MMIEKSIPQRDLALPRILALVLFVIAGFIAIPMPAIILSFPFPGNWTVLPIALGIAGAVTWLGRVLWSGRPFPTWFIPSFSALVVLMTFVGLAVSGQSGWAGGLLLTMSLAWLANFAGAASPTAKPPKPCSFDEL